MTFDEQYQDALAFFQKAKDELANGNYDISLFQVRKALENIVKRVCERHAINVKDTTGKTVSLLELIDQLGNRGIISENDVHLLHQIRFLGNKGVHNDIPPTHRDAQTAINKFSQALKVFNRLYNKEQAKMNNGQSQKATHKPKNKASRKKSAPSKLRKWLVFILIVTLLIFGGWFCIKNEYVDSATIAAIDDYIYSMSVKMITAIDDSLDIETIEPVDPFDYIELEFSGLSSKATATIKQLEQHEFFNSLDGYTLAQKVGLSNGDTVKISIDRSVLREAIKQGYIVSQTERMYKVSGLPEAVLSLSDIPPQSLESMKEDCESLFWKQIDEEILSSAGLNVNLDYMGAYLYTNPNWIEKNVLHIVYQVDATRGDDLKETTNKFSYYYCAMYERLVNTEGVISKETIEICNPYFVHGDIGYFGYQMLDELYQTTPLCQSKGMGYLCEAAVANETVIYTGQLPDPYYPNSIDEIPDNLRSEMIEVAQEKIEEYAATWDYPKTFNGMECLDTILVMQMGSEGNTVVLSYRVDVQPRTKYHDLRNFYYFVAFENVCRSGYESWDALSAPLTPKHSFLHDVYGIGFMDFLTYIGYETFEEFETDLHAFQTGKLSTRNFFSSP